MRISFLLKLANRSLFLFTYDLFSKTIHFLKENMAQSRTLFVYFDLCTILKVKLLCLLFKLGAAGWNAQTHPLSFGSPPYNYLIFIVPFICKTISFWAVVVV